MKVNSLYKTWTAVLIVLVLFSCILRAEERSIYIGDLINLEIHSNNYTLEDLEEKFKGFEIVKSKEIEQDFELTLRTFEPGEYSIILGNRKIEILVNSTLEDIEKENIYSGDLSPLESSYSPVWIYMFYVSSMLLLSIFIILIWKFVKNKKQAERTPHQKFLKKISEVETNEDNYFVELTFLFKEYLENKYNCQIKGKTSEEIVRELTSVSQLKEKLGEINDWLRLADYYKYTGTNAPIEIKERQQNKLKELAGEIEAIQQEEEG